MNDGETIRARQRIDGTMERVLPNGSTRPLTGDSDWPRLLAMTEEEIEANAASDPDNPPLSPDELARLRPVSEPREIRQRLRMTKKSSPPASASHPPSSAAGSGARGTRTGRPAPSSA